MPVLKPKLTVNKEQFETNNDADDIIVEVYIYNTMKYIGIAKKTCNNLLYHF